MPSRPTPVAVRAYRALLWCYPRAVREAEGADIVRQFEDEWRARRARPVARARLLVIGILDAVWHGTLERLAVRRSVSAGRSVVADVHVRGRASAASRFADALAVDVRLGLRRLWMAPGFTVVAVTTLALGIGANTTIFSVVNAVLIRPLPFSEPDRLVGVFHMWEGERDAFSPPNFLDVQARSTTLEAVGAYSRSRFILTGAGEPASIVGARVSQGFFETLATRPEIGRWPQRPDHDEGAARVVVLGHALWMIRFGGDAGVLDRSVTLEGTPYEVIGVMPAGFAWPGDAALWVPAVYDEDYRVANRGAWFLDVIGRLARDVTVEQAVAEVAGLGAALEREYPEENTHLGMTVHPLLDAVVGETRSALLVLLAAVGFVLLIACANVANLCLARASAREAEMALRAALGAGRGRLVRHLLVEGLLLAAIGGLAGFALAVWGVELLVRGFPATVPRLADVGMDRTVMLFTTAATLLTGFVFGALPGLQISRRRLAEALGDRGRSGTPGRRMHRARGVLVVVETALAVVLLAGAGLLARSFVKLSEVDPGFTVGKALTFQVVLPRSMYPDDEHRATFYRTLRERLAAIPGVSAQGAVLGLPPGGSLLYLSFSVRGRPEAPPGEEPAMEVRIADAGYFDVMGIPVQRGRGLTEADRAGSERVMVLTESAVREYFADDDPIGRYLEVGWNREDGLVGGTVVGVVGDVKSFGLDQDAPPQVYVPLAQLPIQQMNVVLRTTGDAASLAPSVRQLFADLDPNFPVPEVATLDEHVRRSIAEPRFFMLLLGVFAAAAMLLAGVGLFGVMSIVVAERTRELGVRMALGASPGAVLRLVVGQAIGLTGVGVLIGIGGALALAQLLDSMLFGLPASDPVSFGVAAVGLLTVALAAAWMPVRRAAAVDPIVVLRGE